MRPTTPGNDDAHGNRDRSRRSWTWSRRPSQRPRFRPVMEGLEHRIVMSMITWNTTVAPTGGNWDSGTSWTGGNVPTSADDAVITLPSTGSFSVALGANDSVRSLSTSGPLTLKLTGGSLSLGTGSSTFGSPVELTSGVTLNVDDNVSVLLDAFNQSLTVDAGGEPKIGRLAKVVQQEFGSGGTEGIVVNGSMTATGASFSVAGGGDNAQIVVNGPSGHLIATDSEFSWNNLILNVGSTDTLQFVAFATELAINSGATIDIHSDDFSSTGATVVASTLHGRDRPHQQISGVRSTPRRLRPRSRTTPITPTFRLCCMNPS